MLLLDLEEGRERLEVWPDAGAAGEALEGGDAGDRDARATVYPTRPGEGFYECVEPVERFVDLCLGRPAENDAPGEVGLRAVEVLDAAYRSARSGRLEDV